MKTLNFTNHNIKIQIFGNGYIITPYYYKNNFNKDEEVMGYISLNKTEMAQLIVELTELLHGKC